VTRPTSRNTDSLPRNQRTQPLRRFVDPVHALLAGAVAWLVYLRTVAPTVYGLDSAELTTGSYLLGVTHAPGAPVFLLLGHVFTWLPFGDVGYRLNLLSACAAAGALPFLYGVHRRLGVQPLLALATTWFLAFTYFYWITAVAAELYALQAFSVAVLLWLVLRWRENPTLLRGAGLAMLFGVGLGVHLSLVLLAPGLALLMVSGSTRSWRRPSWWLAAGGAALLGASVYLYLPLRSDSPMNYARDFGVDLRTWSGFWWMLSGQMFSSQFFAVAPARWPSELAIHAFRLWSNFLGLGLFLGAAGLVADFRRRPAVHTALLMMFGAHLAFVVTYGASDKAVMLVPTYVIWAVWVGLGAAALGRFVRGGSSLPAFLAGAIVGVLAIAALLLNFSYADLSEDWSARRKGEAILERLPHRSVFIGTWREVPILEYLRLVEGRRADVETVNLFFVPWSRRVDMLDRYIAAGRPIFTSEPGKLRNPKLLLHFDPLCNCFEVAGSAEPDRDPAGRGTLTIDLEGRVR
jgi:hypothetical protein